MVRALRPAAAGWWGQELAFGLWWRAQGRREEPDTAALRAYADAVGVPIPITVRYPAFCRDVVRAAGLLRPRRDQAAGAGRVRGWRWLRLLRQGQECGGVECDG